MGVAGVETGDAVRDWNLLESALARPRMAAHYEGADLVRQAATLFWGLVENHPFHDGNKRTAWVGAETFLRRNGWIITCSDDEAFPVVISIAQGLDLDAVDTWLRACVKQNP